jgi:type IV pilus assembly protein PilE
MNGSACRHWPRRLADNPPMCRNRPANPLRTGFTLVELMIVLAVLAVLAALAWPSFQEAVQKSRRADGMSALANLMQAQERWRANNPTYQATLADLPGGQAATSPDQHYDLSLVEGSVTATSYTARATARSGSPQSADSRCQALQVAVNGGNITYSSLASGGGANAAPDPCWVR